MGLFDLAKKIAVSVLDPTRASESQELQYLRQIYYNQQGNLKMGQWYRLLTESGNCSGFSFCCNCGREYKLVSAWEWFKDYECPLCKTKFELLKFVGINPKELPVTQWKNFCDAQLPARPSHVAERPPFVDSWNDSDPVSWSGEKQSAGVGWK